MRVSKQFEQAIYIVILLAVQSNDDPVKTSLLAEFLDTSETYLQKTMRSLAKANLITSHVTRNGGFSIGPNFEEITAKDIFLAVDSLPNFDVSKQAQKLFILESPDEDRNATFNKYIENTENELQLNLENANDAFLEKLEKIKIIDLIPKDENGSITKHQWLKGL